MVYKKYIKRGNKIHGPYYYESYRDENGKTRSRYLKDYKKDVDTKISTLKKKV